MWIYLQYFISVPRFLQLKVVHIMLLTPVSSQQPCRVDWAKKGDWPKVVSWLELAASQLHRIVGCRKVGSSLMLQETFRQIKAISLAEQAAP